MEDVWKQFEENDITHSAAHHLLAILELRKKRGYARVTDVAKELNITTGSASVNLKSLKNKGWIIEDDNRFLSLSESGEEIARAIIFRNELVKEFFEKVLKVSKEQAEIDACKIEHLVSAETTSKLQKFLKEFHKR